MMTKRGKRLLYLLVLWVVISALAWPAFVLSATVLSYVHAEGWQLDAWTQIPKRELLRHFLDGYKLSCVIAIPVGFVAVVDYLLLARYRITWLLAGILLPIAGAVIAFTLYKQPEVALPTLVFAGVILAIVHRLIDIVAGSESRGRER